MQKHIRGLDERCRAPKKSVMGRGKVLGEWTEMSEENLTDVNEYHGG